MSRELISKTAVYHELKIQERWMMRLLDGSKISEIRYNDRDFQKGDVIRFVTHDEAGVELIDTERVITHVLTDSTFPGLTYGYCALSLARLED